MIIRAISQNVRFAKTLCCRGTDTLKQDQDGRQVEETGKWMFVYRREPDGTWKFHWITFNSNQ